LWSRRSSTVVLNSRVSGLGSSTVKVAASAPPVRLRPELALQLHQAPMAPSPPVGGHVVGRRDERTVQPAMQMPAPCRCAPLTAVRVAVPSCQRTGHGRRSVTLPKASEGPGKSHPPIILGRKLRCARSIRRVVLPAVLGGRYTLGTHPTGGQGSAAGTSGHDGLREPAGEQRDMAVNRQHLRRRGRVRVSPPSTSRFKASRWALMAVCLLGLLP
jgi:hypothetical protein